MARQLHLLYDGSGQSARMDHDPAAAAAARAVAADLLDAALTRGRATRELRATCPPGDGCKYVTYTVRPNASVKLTISSHIFAGY